MQTVKLLILVFFIVDHNPSQEPILKVETRGQKMGQHAKYSKYTIVC